MGVYNTVHGDCPHCGSDTTMQDKSGDPDFSDFFVGNLPISVASSLNGEIDTCDECGDRIIFEASIPKRVIGVFNTVE